MSLATFPWIQQHLVIPLATGQRPSFRYPQTPWLGEAVGGTHYNRKLLRLQCQTFLSIAVEHQPSKGVRTLEWLPWVRLVCHTSGLRHRHYPSIHHLRPTTRGLGPSMVTSDFYILHHPPQRTKFHSNFVLETEIVNSLVSSRCTFGTRCEVPF